jgi:SAM-dependent methyltransferase
VTEWFADESFWEVFFPILFPDERFEVAEEQVEKALALVGFRGQSVLDLACGPGRHAVALAERGFRVTGVDLSPFLLAKAMERGEAAGVDVEWVHEDMRRFCRAASFDLCLSMFTSFGYFESRGDDVAVLRNVHASLKPGGACLIDVVGKEWLAKHLQATTSRELPDGALVIERHEMFDDWSRIRNHWILLQRSTAREYRFEHTIYSAREMKDALLSVGFESVSIFGDLDGGGYGPDARRLTAVAKKQTR